MSVDAARRSVGLVISVGSVLLIAGRVPSALKQTPFFDPWWTAGALACLALTIGLAGLGRRLPDRVLLVSWAAAPTLAWLLLLTWAGAYHGPGVDQLDPWFRGLMPALLCYPVLLARPWPAFLLAVGITLTPALSTWLFTGAVTPRFATDTVMHFGNLMFVGIVAGVLARLRQLEAQEARTQRLRALELAAQAAAERQLAVARLVHDELLSTLVGALHSDGAQAARDAAGQVLTRLRTAAVPPSGMVRLPPALRQLDEVVRAEGATVEVAGPLADAEFPSVVVDAVAQAAAEAVRNAVRHGGGQPRVTISAPLSAASVTADRLPSRRGLVPGDGRSTTTPALDAVGLRMIVEDDGPGFDPYSLPPDRLGVRHSIAGRVHEVGGAAEFGGSPDSGARVELRWPA
mgnify:CR=1 FL=1